MLFTSAMDRSNQRKRTVFHKVLSFGSVVFSVLIFEALSPVLMEANAQQTNRGTPGNCARRVAGSYFTTITGDVAGNPYSSRAVVTFTEGGQFFVVDSNQAGAEGQYAPFTDIQGAWSCGRSRAIKAVGINFGLPSEFGPTNIGRVTYQGSYANEAISGTIDLRLFNLDDDPLAANVPVVATFQFSGEQITAH